MKQLISFAYNNPPLFNKNELLCRKKTISFENTILYYAKKSGVTSMIFLFLSQFSSKKYLYMDFKDVMLKNKDFLILIQEVYDFIKINKQIILVVIENAPFVIDDIFINEIVFIFSINIELKTKKLKNRNNFKILDLYPLDFEEYVLFKKNNTDNVFNFFIKDSTFANIVKNTTPLLHIAMQDIIFSSLVSKQEKEIFYLYLNHQGFDISIFQMYNKIKKEIKISKDVFYKVSKKLQEKKFIFLIQKYNQPAINKRIYFLDFNMPKAIKTTTNIKESIKNAILLEMIKKDIDINEIFYADELDFYIPSQKRSILLMIFTELDDIKEHIWYLDAMININKDYLELVDIITIDEQISGYTKKIKGVEYKISTFWEFATR